MRTAIVVLLLALTAAVIAAPARELAVANIPWLSDAMKAPCGKTMFEWNLATGRIVAERVQLDDALDAIEIMPTVTQKGLLVKVNASARPGFVWPPKDSSKAASIIDTDSRHAADIVRKRFGGDASFPNGVNLYILFSIEGRLLAVRTVNYYKPIPSTATRAQQEAAVVELMSH